MAITTHLPEHSKAQHGKRSYMATTTLPSSMPMAYGMPAVYDESLLDEMRSDTAHSEASIRQTSSASIGGTRDVAQAIRNHKERNLSLKKSFSSTDAETLHQTSNEEPRSPAASGAPGEKKRNKLGYHRTSVACNYCRRRKIRCIPKAEDIHNRCESCIKLKKECNFCPVEQQPGSEENARLSSQTTTGTASSIASDSPSPAVGNGRPLNMTQQPYVPLTVTPLPSMASRGSQSAGSDYFVPGSEGAPNGLSPPTPYDISNASATNWMPADMEPNTVSRPEDINVGWQTNQLGSPMNAQFSPFGQTSAVSPTWGDSDAGTRDGFAWSGNFPAASRSMSYSGESSDSHQQPQYLAMAQGQFGRRASNFSDMYPTPLGIPVGSMHPSMVTGVDPTGAIIPGAVHHTDPGSWQTNVHAQEHNTYSGPTGGYGDWEFMRSSGHGQL